MRRVMAVAAWVLGLAATALTLGPAAARPQLGHPQIERFCAFLILGLAWGGAHPRRRGWAAVGLAAAAALLELAQGAAPGRDPRLADALAKIAGAIAGVALTALAARLLRPAAPAEETA